MLDRKACFERGLLRRVKPSEEKGRMSINKSKTILDEAESCLKTAHDFTERMQTLLGKA